jgi:hypothetical protein
MPRTRAPRSWQRGFGRAHALGADEAWRGCDGEQVHDTGQEGARRSLAAHRASRPLPQKRRHRLSGRPPPVRKARPARRYADAELRAARGRGAARLRGASQVRPTPFRATLHRRQRRARGPRGARAAPRGPRDADASTRRFDTAICVLAAPSTPPLPVRCRPGAFRSRLAAARRSGGCTRACRRETRAHDPRRRCVGRGDAKNGAISWQQTLTPLAIARSQPRVGVAERLRGLCARAAGAPRRGRRCRTR